MHKRTHEQAEINKATHKEKMRRKKEANKARPEILSTPEGEISRKRNAVKGLGRPVKGKENATKV